MSLLPDMDGDVAPPIVSPLSVSASSDGGNEQYGNIPGMFGVFCFKARFRHSHWHACSSAPPIPKFAQKNKEREASSAYRSVNDLRNDPPRVCKDVIMCSFVRIEPNTKNQPDTALSPEEGEVEGEDLSLQYATLPEEQ